MSDAKVALVTGASSGIGEDTARLLHEQGFTVYAVARRLEPMQKLAELSVRVFGMDVTDDESVTAGIQKIIAETGRIDVLVNNAADTRLFRLADAQVEAWSTQIDVNIKGVLHGIAAALPKMLLQGSGHIINVASTLSTTVLPTSSVYSATKFALRAISEGVRIETAGKIRSTIIHPGATATEVVTTVAYKRLSADAIASGIEYAIAQPDDVGVNEITIRPVEQPN